VRAVLDPNVIISALLSPEGAPARTLLAWQQGLFELVISAGLLAELQRALAYPKLRSRIDPGAAAELIEWLTRNATLAEDPVEAPVRSADAGDDYLLALAAAERAMLVSGDKHLLALSEQLPISRPVRFLELVESPRRP
jgi:putative PIN family toxin of toxin-antitoxin system